MPANPPEGYPRVSPYLLYEDVAGALDWLTKAFGFKERMRMPEPDGRISHAEVELTADSVIMLGNPGPDYQNPKRLGHSTQFQYIYVDEIDKHYERAKGAGAKIIEAPTDQVYGDRRYAAEDPEGHQWWFAQHIRDVSPEEMQQGG